MAYHLTVCRGGQGAIAEDNARERDIRQHPARPSGGPFDLTLPADADSPDIDLATAAMGMDPGGLEETRIVKAHGGLTGRTGTPCSYCDGDDHTFVDCALAAAFGRGEA